MIRITTLLLVCSAATALAQTPAPAKPIVPAAPTSATDRVIIKAGAVEVRESEFSAAIKSLPPDYQTYATGPGKKEFAEDFLRMKLLAAEAQKNRLDQSPEVAAQLKIMRENVLANAQLVQLEKNAKVTDAELQKAYAEAKPKLEQTKARHILIAFKGSPAARPGKKELTEAEAKAKAEAIQKRLVAKEDFAKIAIAESDDAGSGAQGGDLGFFSRGQMVPEFDQAAFGMKPGEISAPIRTQFGYHVVQVQERKVAPLGEVRPQLEKQLAQKRVQDSIEALKTGSPATFDPVFFAPPPPPPPPAGAPGAVPPPTAPPAPPVKPNGSTDQ